MIMGPAKYKSLTDRVIDYTQAMLEAGLGPDLELMQLSLSSGVPNKGYREMQAILSRKKLPTAVFCVSDRTAFGALKAIKEAGLHIPEDIALVGFDDTRDSEHTTPPLTTVCMPKRGIGRVAIELLDQRMNNCNSETSPLKLLLPTSLVVRDST
jgi:DNA-binding LacI/PurR family transcriptional regulator